MKNLIKILTIAASIAGTSSFAQVQLQDFSAVVDSNYTVFSGTWEASVTTADSAAPNSSFSQGVGSYSFAASNATDNALSKVEFFFSSPANILTNTFLAVTAQGLAGYTATSFAVTLVDTGGQTAAATFLISGFPTGSFTTQYSQLTFGGSFNPTAIDSMFITGNIPGGSSTFGVSFDNISAVASASAVPEPATYALIAGVLMLGVMVVRRRAHQRSV